MPRGGKREGAGRKPGTVEANTVRKQALRARILAKFEEKLEEMVEAQVQHAMGVSYMVLRAPDGSFARATDEKQIDAACAIGASAFKIFTQAPNTQAFTAIADRAIDKPSEHVELTGEAGGPLVVTWQR